MAYKRRKIGHGERLTKEEKKKEEKIYKKLALSGASPTQIMKELGLKFDWNGTTQLARIRKRVLAKATGDELKRLSRWATKRGRKQAIRADIVLDLRKKGHGWKSIERTMAPRRWAGSNFISMYRDFLIDSLTEGRNKRLVQATRRKAGGNPKPDILEVYYDYFLSKYNKFKDARIKKELEKAEKDIQKKSGFEGRVSVMKRNALKKLAEQRGLRV